LFKSFKRTVERLLLFVCFIGIRKPAEGYVRLIGLGMAPKESGKKVHVRVRKQAKVESLSGKPSAG
jgi:hypothetical protein